jgi:hypothetical protein
MKADRLLRAVLDCTRCGKGDIHIVTQDAEHKIEALCWTCQDKAEKAGQKPREIAAAYPCGIHPSFDLVVKARIHKLSNGYERRGRILSLTMKDIPNWQMTLRHGIEVAQFTMLLGGRYGIHNPGQEGEQNSVWINFVNLGKPIQIYIDHKYLDDTEIECIRGSVRLLAERWGWELEDDTIDPLQALAKL